MSNIATTIPQSNKLIEAGLDPETADMKYVSIFNFTGTNQYVLDIRTIVENFEEDDIPAWSLSSLIDMCNDCGFVGAEFMIGDCWSSTVIESFVNFIIGMLTDDGEDDDIGDIERFQKKYKVKNNE